MHKSFLKMFNKYKNIYEKYKYKKKKDLLSVNII